MDFKQRSKSAASGLLPLYKWFVCTLQGACTSHNQVLVLTLQSCLCTHYKAVCAHTTRPLAQMLQAVCSPITNSITQANGR
ncbi:hypothetical protein HMPREF2955_04465 [Prevotella sp. HMSC073D09]|nr:hypothetical protein HMPREF2955_04465 [Prevotella sp. HMSC073D09]